MIKIKNLSKTYKNEQVIKPLELELKENKIYGIVGRNGSGKTVLMKMICGLTIPTTGTIEIDGDIIGEDIDFPRSIGIIIETPGFISYQSAFSNLKRLAVIQNKIDDNDICTAIEKVGLDPKSKKRVGKYSLGMRQRLGIAQAIMENPKILMLDEPMNGLDNEGVEDIRNLLLSMKNEERIIIITSHNKEDIEVLCDEVFEMNKGEIISK